MADQSKPSVGQIESVDDLFAYIEGKLEDLKPKIQEMGFREWTKEISIVFPYSLLIDRSNPISRAVRVRDLIRMPNCSSQASLSIFDLRWYARDGHTRPMLGYAVKLEDGDYRELRSEFGLKITGFFAPSPELEEDRLPYWSFDTKRERRMFELPGEGIESMNIEHWNYSNDLQSPNLVSRQISLINASPESLEGMIWLLKELKTRPEGLEL